MAEYEITFLPSTKMIRGKFGFEFSFPTSPTLLPLSISLPTTLSPLSFVFHPSEPNNMARVSQIKHTREKVFNLDFRPPRGSSRVKWEVEKI